jgi:hypothetical protein
MRQAIVTKYLPPTNIRGSKVSVKAFAGRQTIAWDHALNDEENHRRAAAIFADRLGWLDRNTLYGGSMPDGSGYCFVLVSEEEK